MAVLVIAEHDNEFLRPATLNVIAAAQQLNEEIKILVAGFNCIGVVSQLQQISGIKEIMLANHEVYKIPLAETLTPLILAIIKDAHYLLAPATTFGKNLLPRVAACLNVGQISDVISILGSRTYQRPIYAGNAIANIESMDDLQVLTIRPTAFKPVELGNPQVTTVSNINYIAKNEQTCFVSQRLQSKETPDLATSKIVISGGRGLANKENFDRLTQIAHRLGAAIGASRAAVDSGMAANDLQVGQTGQVVAPKLYIAVGISGAIQHLAGMKDSGIVVAINSDPEAPIFQVADYAIVGDIQQIFPEWENILTEMGY